MTYKLEPEKKTKTKPVLYHISERKHKIKLITKLIGPLSREQSAIYIEPLEKDDNLSYKACGQPQSERLKMSNINNITL